MGDRHSAGLAGIPDDARPTFEQLLVQPLARPEALASRVDAHLAALRTAARHNEFLDLALAETIAGHCHRLLQHWPRASADQQRLIQAAVGYFATSGDADDDFDSIAGLDDDAQVINAVLAHLGLDPMPLP